METVPACSKPEHVNGDGAGGSGTVFVLRPRSNFGHQIEPPLHVPMQGQKTTLQLFLQCLWLWAINLETEHTEKCLGRIFATHLCDDLASQSSISDGIKCDVLTPHGRGNFDSHLAVCV